MAEQTGIGWTDATFNPWVGCAKVSPGCANCYAETLVTGRMGRPGTWGPRGTRERTSEANWRKPLRWAALAREGRLPDGSENRDGHRPRVFCASLADVFEPRPELDPWRLDLLRLIEDTPELDWQLLTKRPEVARDWLRDWYESWERVEDLLTGTAREWVSREQIPWGVLPNVWVGVSIENARHTYRADWLRRIPAAVRFISAEPLLGSLYPALSEPSGSGVTGNPGCCPANDTDRRLAERRKSALDLTGIDWVIVGGESGGRDARPMHPDWAREIRDACLMAGNRPLDDAFVLGAPDDVIAEGVRDEMIGRDRPALFFKQWGSWALCAWQDAETLLLPCGRRDRITNVGSPGVPMRYVGASPKSGGKLLDGVEWCEFPEPQAVPA